MKLSAKIAISLFLFTWIAGGAAAQNNIIDEIVWVVGDEAILKSEVEEYRKDIQMQNQRIEGDPYCFIPEQLAINKLFLDQAKVDSIEVNEANVNRMLEYYMNEYISSTGSVEKLEEYFGKSLKKIREDLRTQLREQQLIQGVQQKHFDNVSLAPSEIRKFYNKIPQDSLPFIPTTLEIQIITVEPEVPLKEIDAVKNRLREFTEQINSVRNPSQHWPAPSRSRFGLKEARWISRPGRNLFRSLPMWLLHLTTRQKCRTSSRRNMDSTSFNL